MLYQEKSGNPDWGRVCHQNLNEKDPISCTKTYLEKMCGFGSFEKTAKISRCCSYYMLTSCRTRCITWCVALCMNQFRTKLCRREIHGAQGGWLFLKWVQKFKRNKIHRYMWGYKQVKRSGIVMNG
jgi:hypothetical protein